MVTYYGATMEDMEPVFRALSDPNRRYLLDLLHERDGQTLLELQGHLIQFDGDRDAVRRQSVEYAFNLLRELPPRPGG